MATYDDAPVRGNDADGPVAVRLTPEAFAKPPGGVRRTAVDLLAALRAAGANVSAPRFAERVTPTSPVPSKLSRAMMQLDEARYFACRRVWRSGGVAHSLYYDQQVRLGQWPLVVTVHDMIHERFGEGSKSLRLAKRLSVHRASLIITPSRASASDLARIYPDARAEVVTIPWGVDPTFLTEAQEPLLNVAEPFLLYVGARSGYKNISVLIRALAAARDLDELCLVLVGGEPLLSNERQALVDALVTDERLIHLASPPDAVLRGLYDAAAALVVTSKCEGFGLPIVEAMARGCPVACSAGGASAEVAGGHAAMFSPHSAQGCAQAIREAINLPHAQRASCRLYARRYDWETTARAHLDAYEWTQASR